MRNQTEVKKLITYFKEKFFSGEYSPGSKIPSIRAMKKRLRLSEGTVRQCFDLLNKDGLIEIIHGSGTYVKNMLSSNEIPFNKSLSILIFGHPALSHENAGIYSAILSGIEKVTKKYNCCLTFRHINLRKSSYNKEIAKLMENCDGAIALIELERCSLLVNPTIPVVAIGTHLPVISNLSFIDIDPYTAAFLAVKYFKRHNIDKVNILSNKIPAYLNRGDIFASMWKQSGGKFNKIYSVRIKKINYSKEEGYLFTTGSRLQSFSQNYKEISERILSEDYCILGIDGKSLIRAGYYPTPCIAINWMQAGEEALEECVARIKQPGRVPRRIYIEGYLVE